MDGHQSAPSPLELFLNGFLELNIERKPKIRPRNRVNTAKRPNRPTRSGDLHLFDPGAPVESFFPRLFYTLFAYDLRAAVVSNLAFFFKALQVCLRNPTDVAKHVRRRFSMRVLAYPSRA